MNEGLAVQYARRFIQRRDVKAVQFSHGGYSPDRELKNLGHYAPLGWEMPHLMQHLNGQATYGHYLLDADDMARFFCFDIDLQKTGFYVPLPSWDPSISDEQWAQEIAPVALGNPADPADRSLRNSWLDRAHPARNWLKLQMGTLARRLCSVIMSELQLGCAAAYSGHKGIHVYGFTGPMPAREVREAALYVLDYMDEWKPLKGQHFFTHKVEDPSLGYQNFSVEVFPKQDSLEGKDLGNLLRLPLGRNLKGPADEPTFFIDLTTPPGVMAPHPDPVRLLETGNPYL